MPFLVGVAVVRPSIVDVFATDLKGGTTINRQEVPWPTADRVTLVDTPGLAEVDGADHIAVAAEAAHPFQPVRLAPTE